MRKIAAPLVGVVLLAICMGHARAAGFATHFAALASNGALSSSSGVHTAARTGLGIYDVTFSRFVKDCGFTVSVTGPTPGFASANRTSGRTITVSTFSKSGVATNLPSTLILVCGP